MFIIVIGTRFRINAQNGGNQRLLFTAKKDLRLPSTFVQVTVAAMKTVCCLGQPALRMTVFQPNLFQATSHCGKITDIV